MMSTPHRKDLALDLRDELPFTHETLTFVYAGHVLEHMTPEESQSLLARLLPCMTIGGELMIVGPDVDATRQLLAIGAEMHGATLESVVHGAGRWSGDVHLWEWTAVRTAEMLVATGWSDVELLHVNDVPDMWPVAERAPQWQRAVCAVRS